MVSVEKNTLEHYNLLAFEKSHNPLKSLSVFVLSILEFNLEFYWVRVWLNSRMFIALSEARRKKELRVQLVEGSVEGDLSS